MNSDFVVLRMVQFWCVSTYQEGHPHSLAEKPWRMLRCRSTLPTASRVMVKEPTSIDKIQKLLRYSCQHISPEVYPNDFRLDGIYSTCGERLTRIGDATSLMKVYPHARDPVFTTSELRSPHRSTLSSNPSPVLSADHKEFCIWLPIRLHPYQPHTEAGQGVVEKEDIRTLSPTKQVLVRKDHMTRRGLWQYTPFHVSWRIFADCVLSSTCQSYVAHCWNHCTTVTQPCFNFSFRYWQEALCKMPRRLRSWLMNRMLYVLCNAGNKLR